jgi:hypothetical protein
MRFILLQAQSDTPATFLFLLAIAGLLYLIAVDRRKSIDKQRRQKFPDISLLERHRPLLSYFSQKTKDGRILKAGERQAELVGYLNDHKVYVSLQDIILHKPFLFVTVSVVTRRETRKKRLFYQEPIEDIVVWDAVAVETEKLIDNI